MIEKMDKNSVINILRNNFIRSTKAYSIYLRRKTYYNAKRIYNANEIVYHSLNQLLQYDLTDNELGEIINYQFHLENWFIQFQNKEKKILSIEEEFVFEPFEDNIPFPKNFLEIFDI
ncbi:Uncharacterised protein [Bergeyella zoohelcum]|uniref:Uncharacterized protein n=2 Tax=Flavobacteriia TaxID=117743 RepID=A0A7Z8YPL5_9FLAO|nr:hypothetical protein CAPN008_09960 [Capnocytophaga canis]VDH05101.1 Uncharacterised protein [Bergeyella zoohelcum]